MDSKGRPTAADIADKQMLSSIASGTVGDLTMFFPRKVLEAKADKLVRRGLASRFRAGAYLITDKGREILAPKPAPAPAA